MMAVEVVKPPAALQGAAERTDGMDARQSRPAAREGMATLTEETDLEALLHSLSQPLTSISLALGIANAPITEEERERVLHTAQSECVRAMHQVQALRAMVNASRKAGASRPDGGS